MRLTKGLYTEICAVSGKPQNNFEVLMDKQGRNITKGARKGPQHPLRVELGLFVVPSFSEKCGFSAKNGTVTKEGRRREEMRWKYPSIFPCFLLCSSWHRLSVSQMSPELASLGTLVMQFPDSETERGVPMLFLCALHMIIIS